MADIFDLTRQSAAQEQAQLQRDANAHHRAMMAAQAAINAESLRAAQAATKAAELQAHYWRERLTLDQATAETQQAAHRAMQKAAEIEMALIREM